MIPPIPPSNRLDLWEEYKVLEARLHSDSTISYAILGSFLAGSFVLFSVFVSTLLAAAELEKATISDWALPVITGFFAAILVYLGSRIFMRFNDTGEIRRSRAVHLEKVLGISSFRMFPPWVVVDPDDYLALGEIFSRVSWNGDPRTRQALEVKGIQEYWRIQNERRISSLIRFLPAVVVFVLIFIFGLVIGLAAA